MSLFRDHKWWFFVGIFVGYITMTIGILMVGVTPIEQFLLYAGVSDTWMTEILRSYTLYEVVLALVTGSVLLFIVLVVGYALRTLAGKVRNHSSEDEDTVDVECDLDDVLNGGLGKLIEQTLQEFSSMPYTGPDVRVTDSVVSLSVEYLLPDGMRLDEYGLARALEQGIHIGEKDDLGAVEIGHSGWRISPDVTFRTSQPRGLRVVLVVVRWLRADGEDLSFIDQDIERIKNSVSITIEILKKDVVIHNSSFGNHEASGTSLLTTRR